MKQSVIKYGLIGGVILAFFMCITIPFMDENTESSHAEIIGFAGMIVAFATIFIGIIKYRNHSLNGTISFWKAFQVGFLISLIASTLYVVTWMILSEFFVADFMANYTENAIETVKESSLSDDKKMKKIADYENMAENYKNPLFKFFITYIEVLPLGILISIIAAVILRRKAK